MMEGREPQGNEHALKDQNWIFLSGYISFAVRCHDGIAYMLSVQLMGSLLQILTASAPGGTH